MQRYDDRCNSQAGGSKMVILLGTIRYPAMTNIIEPGRGCRQRFGISYWVGGGRWEVGGNFLYFDEGDVKIELESG